MDGACSTHGKMRRTCGILIRNSERKKPVLRPSRGQDSIKKIIKCRLV